MELEQETEIITAGDSILDFPMLKNSMSAFVPAHGELNTKYTQLLSENKTILCTISEGIDSSEELLNRIYKSI